MADLNGFDARTVEPNEGFDVLPAGEYDAAIVASEVKTTTAGDGKYLKLELQVLTRDAELRALRAQVNPHFLYNSLNSISALTGSDAAAARRMCLLLAEFLRTTLRVSSEERITMAEEMKLAERFLSIEQVRFGERLHVEQSIDESALECQVPPLVLQPLLENAVGHGIAVAVGRAPARVLRATDCGRRPRASWPPRGRRSPRRRAREPPG